ncbi:hypothetical protein VOLCADRAFT_104135 [Volvox carteri f. nagariensis]|uniref:ABC transporter domain-containing protein n=1 Tax=Volvox carteri f. nagariensis TaxID=3068 RepID=D8TRH3_VOLCA|nr:uncharacterized protein VOLCADRAFT_104135 [Volvox carteri f. nagariensis]EFJ49894.1 hypothetical protein VOLCADRAFT_104135 [Volvox carteri f. nagariensis]|eukprot:XP_002948959.1 hypothetical protein VOLCADRAFT_104135 [Volvox carteri f. nagariensis]
MASGCVVLAILVALASSSVNWAGAQIQPERDPDKISQICRVATQYDPICTNGGYLNALYRTPDSNSCGHCICPPGWAGVDCSACQTAEVCPPQPMPDGSMLPAAACTSDSVVPTDEEALYGKTLACTCGAPGDVSTEFLCAKQPDTNWLINLLPSNATANWAAGNAVATVIERAGTPDNSNNNYPCDPAGKEDCFNATRFDYAYPGVWDGVFRGCSWKVDDCISPMTGSDCLVFTCAKSEIQCPASYMSKCPGYTLTKCGTAPGSNMPYWMHHCLPGTYPVPGKALKLACKLNKDPDGTFQCFITQERSYVASLGMKCVTGTCLYRMPPPSPPSPPPPEPEPPEPPPAPPYSPGTSPLGGRCCNLVTLLVSIGVVVAGLMVSAAWLSYRDNALATAWAAAASGGGGARGSGFNGGGGWPAAGAGGGGGGGFGAMFGTRRGGGGAGGHRRVPSGAGEAAVPLLHSANPSRMPEGDDDATASSYAPVYHDQYDDDDVGTGGDPYHAGGGGVPPVVLSWHNLHLRVQKASGGTLHILRGVSGIAGGMRDGFGAPCRTANGAGGTGAGGRIVGSSSGGGGGMQAVMGPSGAGKTTLLDVLSGRRSGPGRSGEVRINGRLVTPAQVRVVCGYVLQDDVLPGTTSVLEYLAFNAVLRLPPRRYSQRQRDARVWGLVRRLGLTKVVHSYIGDAHVRGLSGGEKRRVSIAVELLTRPGLLLLDEPTTGLDSTNAARVVEVLAGLAGGGVNVLLSIHQPRPDVLRAMDRMLLLSGDGRVVYGGEVALAAAHFAGLGLGLEPPGPDSGINIADWLLDLVIKSPRDAVAAMADAYHASAAAATTAAAAASLADSPLLLPPPKYCPSYWLQLRALSVRLLRNTYRHPFSVALNFLATLAVAVCLGLIFHNAGTDTSGIQNRLGVLFFMLLYLSLMALSSLPIWRDEKLLFMRERASGVYGTPAYFTAVVLFDLLPMRVLPPTFFALFTFWLVGLHPSCATCILWFIGILVSSNITAATMCMAIGAAAPSNSVANLVGSLTLMLLLLFGGFLLNKDSVPSYCAWISKASFFNYAYEALAINEFHRFPRDFTFTAPIKTSALPPLRISGDGVLKEFGFDVDLFYLDVIMLGLLGAVCCGLTYILLYFSGRAVNAVVTRLHRRRARGSGAGNAGGSGGGEEGEGAGGSEPLLVPEPDSDNEEREVDEARSVVTCSESLSSMMLPMPPTAVHGQTGPVVRARPPSRQLVLPPSSSPPQPQQAASTLTDRVVSIDGGGGGGAGGIIGTWLTQQVAAPAPSPARYGAWTVSVACEGPTEAGGGGGSGMVLSWENVSVRVPLGRGRVRYILQSVSGISGPAPPPLSRSGANAQAKLGGGSADGDGSSAGTTMQREPTAASLSPASSMGQGNGTPHQPRGSASAPAILTAAAAPVSTVVHVVGWPGVSAPPSAVTQAAGGTNGGEYAAAFAQPGGDSSVFAAAPASAVQPLFMAPPHNDGDGGSGGFLSRWGLGPKTLSRFGFRRRAAAGIGGGAGFGAVGFDDRMHLDPATAALGGSGGGGSLAGPGRCCLFAIVGPSGAGKTTLMDVLAGRRHGVRGGVSGEIRINGHRVCGYVAQDIVLPGISTVTEYLTFHAALRLPAALAAAGTGPGSPAATRAAAVVSELGLTRVAHSLIGDEFVRGLSGGEKRRVSIAVELLTRPGLLLLDEPTTGLDSTNAARVVEVLAGLAGGGVNVLLSIHQPRPDVLRAMDRMLLLSGDGQVVYTGPTTRMREHFTSLGYSLPLDTAAVADAVLDLVIRAPLSESSALVEGWRGSEVAAEDAGWMGRVQLGDALLHHQRAQALAGLRKYESSFGHQIAVLSRRRATGLVRHPMLVTLHFVATGLVALGVGAIYWHTGRDTGGIQGRFGALFFMLLFLALLSLSSLPVWRDEALLFMRERASGVYGTAAYFTTVVLWDVVPLRVLPPGLFSLVSYGMIGLRPSARSLAAHWGVLVVANITAAAANMSIGAAVGSVSLANMVGGGKGGRLGSLCVLTSTLFGGFLLSRSRMPQLVAWLADLSYVRYAFEALLIGEFGGATGFRFTGYHQPGTPPDEVPYVDVTGDECPERAGVTAASTITLPTFGFRTDAWWNDVGALLVLMCAFLTSTFLLLRYRGWLLGSRPDGLGVAIQLSGEDETAADRNRQEYEIQAAYEVLFYAVACCQPAALAS